MQKIRHTVCFYMLCLPMIMSAHAELRLPTILSDHMVLQAGIPAPVWGWAAPETTVTVRFAGQEQSTNAGPDGAWLVRLDPLKPSAESRSMKITASAGDPRELVLTDVLVGEVWLCSGQSNMQWPVQNSRGPELEKAKAKNPHIRLITVATPGTQAPLTHFDGAWQPCAPDTVGQFSAVGYFFGRELYSHLNVPVGLIDNAWGGSSCEAWIRRDLLEGKELYAPLLEKWKAVEATYDIEKAKAEFQEKLKTWESARKKARAAGKQPPPRPRPPRDKLAGQHRPANLYHGRLKPVMPFAIRGAIWYQGESNASRAYQYRDMFPLMIENWRQDWGQGDFPFYWVQLADFRMESTEPVDSDWAELREAQTMTMDRLEHVGEAVITDLGEAKDIHPRQKREVAQRLARWALANPYGLNLAYRSPSYKEMEIKDGKVIVTFDHVDKGLKTFDVKEAQGFAIAGSDRKWVGADAETKGLDQVIVWSPKVPNPVAVRYGWADNPVCNLYSHPAWLPATPFRTDDWPGMTVTNLAPNP